MLTHHQIWTAIDRLAERHGLSASGLAKRAGLDATTFNRSKRLTGDGHARWPSTESIAKVLEATGESVDAFLGLLAAVARPKPRRVPVIGLAQAGAGGFFDEAGLPAGEGWEEAVFPGSGEEPVYALEITGESMLPFYRKGDTIIVAPTQPIRRGDRVVVKTQEGEVMAKELRRRTERVVELGSANPDHPDRVLKPGEIAWMARIVWASQ